jgi:biopolymer transport protein ExbD/biopolymer transport protein TolR
MSMHFDADDLPAESHEINVTPFIDVMLVLLIIFMVCAPLATVTVPVNLPAASAATAPPPEAPVFVTLRADQALAVNDDVIPPETFAAALDSATKGDRTQRIFLRADGAVSYTALMQLMDRLRAAGFLKISLVAVDKPAP